MLLAGALRFYRLGDWPFAGDELFTLREEASLFMGSEAPQDSQVYRLPQLIPLSYLILHIGNTAFGRDEFGSRLLLAIFGTVIVPIVFLLLEKLKGRSTAVSASLLLAVWPEHVYQSQQTRFYIIAAFFCFLSVLVGAFAAQRRSAYSACVASCRGVAALLCHTETAVSQGIIFAGVLAGALAERQRVPKGILLVFLGTGVLAIGFFAVYLRPLMQGWNEGSAWGYSVTHSVVASVNMLGWPVALLAALGFLLLLQERTAQNWYWVTCALGCGVVTVALPRLVVYQPSYVFPFALGVMVLAGCAIGVLYEYLRHRNLALAFAWTALACMMNLPSLASHYVDGSRVDIRTAAQYVKKNWKLNDCVTGHSMGLFGYYAEGCQPAIPLSRAEPIPKLEELVSRQKRLWVVLQSSRSGLAEDVRRWLGTHCSHELKVRRTRFDYADYAVDVFLYTPDSKK
jgi:uncharacterized membrane protein